ncbi:MAG: hypothetical protein ABR585_11135 [Gemmatimonadaceae bacterium]
MAASRKAWVRAALIAGVAYLIIGRVFAVPTDNVRVSRLAAWVVSAAVYAVHIWDEHGRLRSRSRSTAMHVAFAVAMGAFGLAVAGMIRSMTTPTGFRPRWFLAIVVWPIVTAVPAYVVALLLAATLARFSRSENPT